MTTWMLRSTWLGAGLAFAAFPVLRPWADETTLAGLAAFATDRWVAAHLLGAAGFVLVAVGAYALASRLGSRAARAGAGSAALAAALLLPYYGAEAFGLHAIGQQAAATGDLGLLEVVRAVRFQPAAITLFGLGLLLLPVVGVLLVRATWRLGAGVRVPALMVAVTLAAYLPQFYGPPSLRIAHGILLGLACIALGLAAGRRARPAASAGGGQPVLQVADRSA